MAADTTLRDGEQSPGATLTQNEKVDIARQLARLGVDVCEAGFPIASQGDFEAVSLVAKTAGLISEGRASGQTMRIAGLARANKKDIERCYEAVRHAPLHRIHTFLASSGDLGLGLNPRPRLAPGGTRRAAEEHCSYTAAAAAAAAALHCRLPSSSPPPPCGPDIHLEHQP